MPQLNFQSRVAQAEHLEHFCTQLLSVMGLGKADAALVADSLVQSNLRGIDSHGVARIPHYIACIEQGSINPLPMMHTRVLSSSLALIEGDNAMGQLVMHRAAKEAVHMARVSGAAWVAIKDSSHCGALAYYGQEIARSGMIGFAFTHVDPMVMPYGACKPFCGTNPLCIAAPAGRLGFELCLDMATSITPWNSVMNAAMENSPIPEGWGVDINGKDTTDPHQVHAIYPFGSYKGSGLGLVIDVLCALLSGAPNGPEIPAMYGELINPRHLGGLVGAIDIARFLPLESFETRLLEMLKKWNAMEPAQAGGRVLFPGEPEARCRQRRLNEGIPLGQNLVNQFDQLARRLGVRPLATKEAES